VQFLMQWDGGRVPREQALALFDALASGDKTLRASPASTRNGPVFEVDGALRFLARQRR
jgi:hypothetical protein